MKYSKEVVAGWIDMVINDSKGLTKWEENFVDSIAEQFEKTRSLSDRQEEILERIYTEKVK